MEFITLKVVSPFMVAGQIAKAGELVEVTMTEAKDLLHRGKAEPSTEEDARAAAPKLGMSVGDTMDDEEQPEPSKGKGKKAR